MQAKNAVISKRSEPTARPWVLVDDGDNDRIETADGTPIAKVESGQSNAAHIVHCVNTHDALCDLLTQVVVALEDGPIEACCEGDEGRDLLNRAKRLLKEAKP